MPAAPRYFRFALDDAAPAARRLERAGRLALPRAGAALWRPGAAAPARPATTQVGGFRPLPLMEDVDLVRRLGRRRLVGAAGRGR